MKNNVITYGIPKGKGYGGMLDTVLKQKKLVPSPSQYKIKNDILPAKSNIYPLTDKSPRRTILDEIEHNAKIQKRPGIGAYTINLDQVKPKPKVSPWDRSDRIGYLDEIQYKAKNSPGFYDKSHKLTTTKVKHVVI